MNDGFLGPVAPPEQPLLYVAAASLSYTVTPPAVTHSIPLPLDDGATPMSVTIALKEPRTVLVRWCGQFQNSADTNVARLVPFINGVQAAALESLNGGVIPAQGWYSYLNGESNRQQVYEETYLQLGRGNYTIEIRHSFIVGASPQTWADRLLVVEVLP